MKEQDFYLNILKSEFSRRQSLNPIYSLRSFALFLEINPASLSSILKGDRGLPVNKAKDIADKLKLNELERSKFIESCYRKKITLDEVVIPRNVDKKYVKNSSKEFIENWEYAAILELFQVKHIRLDVKNIAQVFQLSEKRVEQVLHYLLSKKYISYDQNKRLIRNDGLYRTTEDVSSESIVTSHENRMALSLKRMKEVSVHERDYSSLTLAMDKKKLPEVKTLIRDFRNKIIGLLKGGTKSDVYLMNIQFLPLSETSSQKELR